MKKPIYHLVLPIAVAFAFSCGNHETGDATSDTDTLVVEEEAVMEPVVLEVEGIKVYEADLAKTFQEAQLSLNSPTADQVTQTGKQHFSFAVANYELAKQTEDAAHRNCANSAKGQHIHFIVNNGPYAAHYEPEIDGELMEGNNVVLAFLSRSYHESIKTKGAHVLTNYVIGEVEDEFDPTAEHLFYSRPKGSYTGTDAQRILLDFYLINTKLSANGNKVRATIDGKVFVLPKWAPYFVEGLEMGEHSFRIELIDAAGNVVEGPFNDSGDRVITLAAAEGA
jgi:hypothetical protein